MNQDLVTLVSAVIIVIVGIRLWSILGRRNSTDEETPANPFEGHVDALRPQEDLRQRLPPLNGPVPDITPAFKAPPDSVAGGLERIKLLDPTFDEKSFLQSVRVTFKAVVEAFGNGDLAPVRDVLGPKVLPHFEAAIAQRQNAGQSLHSSVIRIVETDTIAAHAEGPRIDLTVHFMSEQENILRDRAGSVVHGTEGKAEEIADTWTFTRDIESPSRAWILAETRS